MPKFIVHLFPMVRVKLKTPIEAESYAEATAIALSGFRPRDLFDHEDDKMVIEDAEEMAYACVDVVDDTEFKKSRWVHLNIGASLGAQIYPHFIGLVRWAKHLCECFGAPPEVVCEAADLNQQIHDELVAQEKGPQ